MKKVVVGVSGGVDSAICVKLLKKQGYEVIGVFLELWENEKLKEAYLDAKKVCELLDIELHVASYKDGFKETIVKNFIEEYKKGRTPNPCVLCNKTTKWKLLYDKMKELDADYIATGHYANVDKLENNRYAIKRSKAGKKDQTYVLYGLSQEILKHIIMPLGDYTKDEIRVMAEELGEFISKKSDSQEICFIEDDDYKRFLRENMKEKIVPGNFVDLEGNILGKHEGIVNYTIGQRKGLKIAFGKPMYVVNINPKDNTVVLGENEDLFTENMFVRDISFMGVEELKVDEKINAMVKIRSAHKEQSCVIEKKDDGILCTFNEKQRAVTKGQSAVFYNEDGYILAGGIIDEA